jgi:hypothetical protein
MHFPSRIRAFALVVSFMAAAPLIAEVPAPSSSGAAAAPAPAPDATSAPAPAPVDPAKEAEIRKLLELTGAVRMVEQMKQQMFAIFRKQASQLPDEFWTRLDKDMDTNSLINKLIPVYDKYYSLDDLKAVNAFYQSPPGQRLLAAQPQILRDSMSIGQDWGRQAGMKVALEMQDFKAKSSGTGTAPAPVP